jgi:hypothetical protein
MCTITYKYIIHVIQYSITIAFISIFEATNIYFNYNPATWDYLDWPEGTRVDR